MLLRIVMILLHWLVLLDFKKAFYTVCHSILLQLLDHHRIKEMYISNMLVTKSFSHKWKIYFTEFLREEKMKNVQKALEEEMERVIGM